MKCDSCQEKATVFYTQVADGKLKKFVLCETCAEAKGVTNPEGLLMADELLAIGKPAPPTNAARPVASSKEECETCGFTLETFRKVGRLGCAQCYSVFSDEITQRLPSMHKGTLHKGYLPAGIEKRQALQGKLSALTAKLKDAVIGERYEEAASLRDEITVLEGQGKGASV